MLNMSNIISQRNEYEEAHGYCTHRGTWLLYTQKKTMYMCDHCNNVYKRKDKFENHVRKCGATVSFSEMDPSLS